MIVRIAWTIAVVAAVVAAPALAEDWPQYRGPGQQGVTAVKNLPVTWSAESGRVWKVKLPGPGSSQPVTKDGKIYVTAYSGYAEVRGKNRAEKTDANQLMLHVVCLDAKDGSEVWRKDLKPLGPVAPPVSAVAKHGYATPTPIIEGETIYCSFGTAGVFALKLADGQKKWEMIPGETCHMWGCAASLEICDDLLLVNASSEADAFLAVRKSDGSEVWRTSESLKVSSRYNRAWSTPMVVPNPRGGKQILLLGMNTLCSFDPADGKTLWTYRTGQGYSASNPTYHGNILYAVTGSGHGPFVSYALSLDPTLGRSERVLWSNKENGSGFSSSVYVDGYLYYAAFSGKERPRSAKGFCCMDAGTGQMVYKEIPDASPTVRRSDVIWAAALAGDGKIYYVTAETVKMYVVEAKPTFKLLAVNTFSDDETWVNAPLVPLDGGRLLVRTDWGLHCVGK